MTWKNLHGRKNRQKVIRKPFWGTIYFYRIIFYCGGTLAFSRRIIRHVGIKSGFGPVAYINFIHQYFMFYYVVWVWDESDLSLKTLDYLRNLVIQSQPLNLIVNSKDLEVIDVREFKNRLFMNILNEGIFIFDNQGNLIRKIKLMLTEKMCFYNEHLFWIENDFLMSMSIRSQEV